MLLSVYALIALASTALATPTPTRELKQASRAQIVRRMKRGLRPRAPLPSGAGGAPTSVLSSTINNTKAQKRYNRFYAGSGLILPPNPSGEDPEYPSIYETYDNSLSTPEAAQECVDLGWRQGAPGFGEEYYSVALWFDESDDLWHCRATFNQNQATDFNAADTNANPVYGFRAED